MIKYVGAWIVLFICLTKVVTVDDLYETLFEHCRTRFVKDKFQPILTFKRPILSNNGASFTLAPDTISQNL